MLLKIQLFLLSLITAEAWKQDGPVLIKLDTQQIIDSLISEDSLRYIELLAQEFATKAAKHFIDRIRDKERKIASQYMVEAKAKKHQSENHVLEKDEALALVVDPPPDGDDLKVGFYELTDDELEATKKPVQGLKKVNGRYFYRRLWEIYK